LALTAFSACAEDIDLFTSGPPNASSAPNILIILDNSANWARNDQAWAIGKQGEAELKALYTIMDDPNINTGVNIGLMMFTSGGPDGAYVRYAIRNMTATNRAAFKEMIGTAACPTANNSLMGTPNCILKNFNGSEKTNSASTIYEASMFEAFKYFGGYTDPAHANLDVAGTPVNSTHFGPGRYSVLDSKADPGAFTDAGKTTYRSPINADGSNSCANNYVIFIGNGYPSQSLGRGILAGINGDTVAPAGIGNKDNVMANYAKFNNLTDVNALVGRQRIQTFTIDVFNAHPDTYQTPLLKAVAKYGGGKYFAARDDQAILNAIRDIIVEIQSVNSVFASASLPINATNRSQNENQVFIGMFRPDADANPRWYGNLKQYQIALFGTEARLADKNGTEAIAATTGFVAPCATSFWTTDSGTYWSFSAPSAGTCTSIAGSSASDLPDGGVVEKGGAGEVLRRGNNPAAVAPFTVSRTMYTCATAPCTTLTTFNTTSVTMARTGAADTTTNTAIVDYTLGKDVNDENGDTNVTEPRPSIHADIAHSRPLPVNFGGTRKVVVYYGSNDGVYRAVEGATGKELWSFVAPEHHSKLKRLYANTPTIAYPNIAVLPGATRKDYFFDGSAGLVQDLNSTRVWIYPTQRRGGRMLYGFDVSNTTPTLKFAVGCPNLADDTGCTSGMSQIGQTWSAPNPAFVKGYSTTDEVLIMGGGYDACEDTDSSVTTCSTPKGNRVYILKASDGSVIASFNTDRSVAADVTLIDRDFDGFVDNAYVADTGGNIYRVDFINNSTYATLASGSWTMTKIAKTSGAARKFLFGPAALAVGAKVYLALGSGDRERPLITNYPYTSPVSNRFYSFYDDFGTLGLPMDLDGAFMQDFSSGSDCDSVLGTGQKGWLMDLNAGRGEQTVTSAVIFGGTVFFSTNRPVSVPPTSCAVNLGEARGYAVNLLNASGVIGSGQLCGGTRSGVFTGGGIPPSPVVGTVPVSVPGGGTKSINVLIGGIDLKTGGGSPIGAQQPPVPIKQIRTRLFWYPGGER
jgi:Tfp pilus tip-associated adhesin PilY1